MITSLLDLDQVVIDRREVERTGSLVLCPPEIEKIIEMGDDGKVAKFKCCEKMLVEHQQPDIPPVFNLSPILSPSHSPSLSSKVAIGSHCLSSCIWEAYHQQPHPPWGCSMPGSIRKPIGNGCASCRIGT